jgi:hypothetical protein
MRLTRFSAAPIAAMFLSSFISACVGAPEDPGHAGAAYDVQRYDLSGTYDWNRGRLVATVGITLTASGPEVVLDSAVTEVKAVRAGAAALPFAVDAKQRKLVIDVSGLPHGEGEPIVLHVDYEAASGRGLLALPARAGDPAASRAIYTSSEPTGARYWMPCHDRPDDRAVFSAELTVGDDESVIANGDLELDARDARAGHRMRYATRYPLPTYLMAFAVTDFEVERGKQGEVPIAVWHRRGVPGDYAGLLGEIGRQIDVFSGKLGPYPFEKYALVMLPEFPGGMENAGITFQSETGTAQPSLAGDVSLDAHELGHQWFGDLVTVATWDDLWIKEGMATLLSAEAGRVFEDHGDAGTLLGDVFSPRDGAAVRDRSLVPGEKYTSGPYDRAAWVLTQIRAVAGEDAFWGGLRRVLDAHRFGVVGTDDVLAAFADVLGPKTTARARKAIDAKALPKIDVADADGGAVVTLHDPEGILIAPITIAWHREDGTIEEEALVPELPRALRRKAAGDFLVIDPRDAHPALDTFFADGETAARFASLVAPLRAPLSAALSPRFAALPGAHVRAAIADGALPPLAPEDLAGFLASLDSEAAKAMSIRAACVAAGAEPDPIERLAWTSAITSALRAEPYYAGLGWVESYDACAVFADPAALFASEWAALAKGSEVASVPEPRLSFLSKFTLPPASALAAWGDVVDRGASPRARQIGARKLNREAARLAAGATADRAAWRARVADLIAGSEVSSVLAPLIRAAVALKGETAADNAAPLAALAEVLRSPATGSVQDQAVCAAAALTAGDANAFRAFAGSVAGEPLAEDVAALLADPAGCDR